MPFLENGSGGSLVVANQHFFTDNSLRDAYFAANPSEKTNGLSISVNNTLQKWDGSVWQNVTPVITGQKGDNAPPVKFQYSENGHSDWSDTLVVASHKFWRWSTDDGLSWSPNYIPYSGEGSGSVPAPYSLIVGNNGKLQLYKSGVLIQEQDEHGSWVANSISTGTGSFHLGDLHSNGSAGENVLWLNTQSNICWFPAWQGINKTDATTYDLTTRKHGTMIANEPLGVQAGSGAVDYTDTFTAPANVAFFKVEIIPEENYTGDLVWQSKFLPADLEVASFFFTATLVAGTRYTVQFKYPLYVKSGQQASISIKKKDGTLLKCRASSLNALKPYRQTFYTSFADHLVYNQSNNDLIARGLESLTDSAALDVFKLKNIGLLSKGLYRGDIPSGLTGLQNASKGDWWKAATSKSLAGTSFAVGDELYCVSNTDANVTNLSNFTKVDNVNQVMIASTQANAGQAGITPVPLAGDVTVLTNRGWGNAEYKDATTNKKYKLIIDNGVPYLEEIV